MVAPTVKPTRAEIDALTGGNRRMTRALETLFEELNKTSGNVSEQSASIGTQEEAIQFVAQAVDAANLEIAALSAKSYVQRGSVVTGSNGQATIAFLNSVDVADDNQVHLTAWRQTGNPPVVVSPVFWIEDGPYRSGVVIEAAQLLELPQAISEVSELDGFPAWGAAVGLRVDWMLY